MNRREVLKSLAAGVVMPVFGSGVPTVTPKALIFDTFGTVVDWRGSIIEEGKTWSKTKGLEIDWAGFADRWRAGYQPAMERVRKGELPWTKLDDLHRMILTWCVQNQLHVSAKHEMRCWLPDCDESVKRTRLYVIEARCFQYRVAIS